MNTQDNIEQTSMVRAYETLVGKHGEQFASLIAFTVFFRDIIAPALAGGEDAMLAIRQDFEGVMNTVAAMLASALSSAPVDDIEEALARMSAASAMDQIVDAGRAKPLRRTLDS